MSRVVIDVTKEEHQKIKALAALHGKSIKNYVLDQILPAKDDKDWTELQTLLADRINRTEATAPVSKSFEELTQEIIQAKS
ncbi:MAG: hypothetical protein OEY56_10220 [Cyclobacteriaceae bacterium]|nr:hypothetical protein [Cyclobacteriaceae bacterium]